MTIFYWIMAALNVLNGLWMIFGPYHWYANVPAAVPDTGPFNPHFVRDIGVVYGLMGIGFAWGAANLGRAYPIHLAITGFYVGHALTHVADIVFGRLPHTHWAIDAPAVFLPAVVLAVLALPGVWRSVVARSRRVLA